MRATSPAEMSIIIATYNPEERILTRVLAAVESLEVEHEGSIECVVVDNNSQRPVNDMACAKAFLDRCHWARVIMEPKQGLTFSRLSGINVKVWGSGWNATSRVSQDEMIRIFNQSRINLNLAEAPCPASTSNNVPHRGGTVRSLFSKSLSALPMGTHVKTLLKRGASQWQSSRNGPTGSFLVAEEAPTKPKQVKKRTFEVSGSGDLLLTEQVEHLEQYYSPGKEIVCFNGVDDLVEQVRSCLRDPDQAAAIAQAGYRRTLQDHTYSKRFSEMFQRIGLE